MPRLIDIQYADEAPRWLAINDNVMGRISQGSLYIEDGNLEVPWLGALSS